MFLQQHRGPAVVGRHGSMMVGDGSYGLLVTGVVGQVRSCGLVCQWCDVNPGFVSSWRCDGDNDRGKIVILFLGQERKGVAGLEGATKVRHVLFIISSCFGFESERLAFRNGLVR